MVDGPRPVWTVGGERTDNGAINGELADAIVYWLWPASEGLQGLMAGESLLTLEILIAEDVLAEGQSAGE